MRVQDSIHKKIIPMFARLLLVAIFGCWATTNWGQTSPVTPSTAAAKSNSKLATGPANAKSDSLTLVVMDPLAAPLACDCVQGYAQRKYEKLGEFLEQKLRRTVTVVFAESLTLALKDTEGKADLVIGKHSVVLDHAKRNDLHMLPVMQLTGKDDSVTQTGLLVVRSSDPAEKVSDLQGYRILFGPADCDEKHSAPMALLKEHSIKLPQPIETAIACSEAAKQLMAMEEGTKAAAVISSYAQPLLEGCGNIKKGDLKIVGESGKVPFITAFVNQQVPESDRDALVAALDEVGLDAEMLIHLETGLGFVPWKGAVQPEVTLKPSLLKPSASEATTTGTKKK